MSDEKNKATGANAPVVNNGIELKGAVKSASELKLEKELEAAKSIISKQSAEMTRLDAQVGSRHTIVPVNGINYRYLGKGNIFIEGKSIAAEDLLQDLDLVTKLIESGSGLFKKHTAAGKAKKGGKK